MNLTAGTVKNYLGSVFENVAVKNRMEAVSFLTQV